jgi:REP-associated tyrosine transposase
MTNHYHLLVETLEVNLSRRMQQLNGIYTHWFDRTHHRVGHVFQGRYKAILVEKDSYLLETARYVVLNPVRAGVVDDSGAWPWSSYTATIGRVKRS